ncbi:hypothetical protein BBJ28_00000454 [Nothophytophthora sp. Chile5]|nr:hypothetical protein BBJ28_00000454 [Nothophytophthora sp. Chile5]
MGKDRFAVNPFPDLHVSEEERQQLLDLVNGYVEDYFHKYEQFVVTEKHKVDECRWKPVKSKDDLHVYTERPRKELERVGLAPSNALSATKTMSPIPAVEKELPVMLSVGTFVGQMDDLMFGVVNPTLDVMRIKASYVHDLDSAAVLCPVVEPSEEEPFRSLVIKWMTIDVPLQSTNLVKSRDYVYIEATGILYFANGDRVGYHLLHSIDFPQTKPLPNKIRGNLSIFGFFRQVNHNVIDNYASGTVDPGGEIMRFLLIPAAAGALLSATNYVYCGQMKKLSWMLQRRHSAMARQGQLRRTDVCVTCAKKTSAGSMGNFGKSTCKLCYGCVCYSCKIRKRISFMTPDGQLLQRKITFCAMCVSEATKCNAQDSARDQAVGRSYRSDGAVPLTIELELCAMEKERFEFNPFPGLVLSEADKGALREVANGIIEENFHKYEDFVVNDKHKVDEHRWKHVKSREDLHIYTERSSPRPSHEVLLASSPAPPTLPVMLSVGTFVGQMDDLMFGVVNPTLDVMRIKASYVHDLDSAAVLTPIIEPTIDEPFQSLIIKWMEIDLPLRSTHLVKNRDYVYMEATGIVHFANGDRVGYHMLHSVDFPQTHALPKKIRGHLSICGFFRQIAPNVIDNYSGGTVDPGGEIMNFLLIPAAAGALLSATNYVYCGQMKKISWMLQRRHSAARSRQNSAALNRAGVCVTCAKKLSTGSLGTLGKGKCKLCFGSVCYSCKIRKRISFMSPDGQLLQRKISFCAMCVSESTKCNAQDAARDQAVGYGAYEALTSSSDTTSEMSGYRE